MINNNIEDKPDIVSININGVRYKAEGVYGLTIQSKIENEYVYFSTINVPKYMLLEYIGQHNKEILIDLYLHDINKEFENNIKEPIETFVITSSNNYVLTLLKCDLIRRNKPISELPTHSLIAEDIQYNLV